MNHLASWPVDPSCPPLQTPPPRSSPCASPQTAAPPNNDRHPAIVARGAIRPSPNDPDGSIRRLFEANGWRGTWTWQVFRYHHFHPDAFEVLGVATGSAVLVIGGEAGRRLEVEAGDVLLLPPGWGHCMLSSSPDFAICGAYPPGQENYTVRRASEGYDEGVIAEIAAVEIPETDPVFGPRGELLGKSIPDP
ncbi:cupin domain-containing protein [Mesorhizobium sp. J428]|uniref:cupin domain-containing protein n=1 Tax=Mesorhizobium sp. J428 TaxID=2898440 RepID=UPI002151F545|nr:cupin domain-containing protein [Mesorhizobium sp. J428]MCR5856950.1 cupin domain-containing protein [Mesorhizobium sp. J428]